MNSIENLKDRTIFVGKEAGNGRLCVSIMINGQPKATVIGEMNSVPNSVSRCKPAEGIAHCKISVHSNGSMVVTNLKPQNVTYVNGAEIASKKIKQNSIIELGRDRFPLNISTVIEAASKIVGATNPPPKQEYSIKSLKEVWEDYNEKVREIKIRQRNIGLLARIPMAFSMFGGLIVGIAPEIREYALTFTGIALFIMLIGIYRQFTDKSIEEMEDITEDFQKRYICPNENCRHFVGTKPYNLLRQDKKCPWCGCIYTEK